MACWQENKLWLFIYQYAFIPIQSYIQLIYDNQLWQGKELLHTSLYFQQQKNTSHLDNVLHVSSEVISPQYYWLLAFIIKWEWKNTDSQHCVTFISNSVVKNLDGPLRHWRNTKRTDMRSWRFAHSFPAFPKKKGKHK